MNLNLKPLLLAGCSLFVVALAVAQEASSAGGIITGKVIQTMNTSGYTYVQVQSGTNQVWAATLQFAVKAGDSVSFAADNPMSNYHSETLNRDFPVVYFAGSITLNDGSSGTTGAAPVLPPGHPPLTGQAAPVLPPGHPSLDGQTASPNLDPTGIKPADGGQTVKQIFAGSSALAGKVVTVRGKVVKYNAMILGKNWLHIRDGSGSAEKNDNDLLVTTTAEAQLGDVVLATGILSTNKDFGASYKYAVMMDDAQVTVEPTP